MGSKMKRTTRQRWRGGEQHLLSNYKEFVSFGKVAWLDRYRHKTSLMGILTLWCCWWDCIEQTQDGDGGEVIVRSQEINKQIHNLQKPKVGWEVQGGHWDAGPGQNGVSCSQLQSASCCGTQRVGVFWGGRHSEGVKKNKNIVYSLWGSQNDMTRGAPRVGLSVVFPQ